MIRDAPVGRRRRCVPGQRFNGRLISSITISRFGDLQSRRAIGDPDAVFVHVLDTVDTAKGHQIELSAGTDIKPVPDGLRRRKAGSDAAYLIDRACDCLERAGEISDLLQAHGAIRFKRGSGTGSSAPQAVADGRLPNPCRAESDARMNGDPGAASAFAFLMIDSQFAQRDSKQRRIPG